MLQGLQTHCTDEKRVGKDGSYRGPILERGNAEVGHKSSRVHGRGEHQGGKEPTTSVSETTVFLLSWARRGVYGVGGDVVVAVCFGSFAWLPPSARR